MNKTVQNAYNIWFCFAEILMVYRKQSITALVKWHPFVKSVEVEDFIFPLLADLLDVGKHNDFDFYEQAPMSSVQT